MAEDLTDIDVSKLDALARLDGEQRAIRALMEKATRRRDREIEVCARVMADYEARLSTSRDQANEIRQQVRNDLQKLQVLYRRHEEALAQAREQLQECEFRHEIGEFDEAEFRRCQQAAERTIGERKVECDGVGKLRERYLDLLGDETPAPPVPEPVVAQTTAVSNEPGPPDDDPTIFLAPPAARDFEVPLDVDADGETRFLEPASHAPAMQSEAMLIEEDGESPGTLHRLGPSTSIGRTPDNQIVVAAVEVSRRHAQIVRVDGGYVVRDLRSPNGTFVNGEPITERRLQEGDKVTLGGRSFVFKAK